MEHILQYSVADGINISAVTVWIFLTCHEKTTYPCGFAVYHLRSTSTTLVVVHESVVLITHQKRKQLSDG